MRSAETVVDALRETGEIWETAPGLIGLRGNALALYRMLEERIFTMARVSGIEEWRVPAGISYATLASAEYFASFPQWLTGLGHLPDDAEALAEIAASANPAEAARARLVPTAAALPPAVCYQVYEALACTEVSSPLLLTVQGTCWRQEGEGTRPLERGWSFTMREIVCLGSDREVEDFRQGAMAAVVALAEELELRPSLETASDPFFAPTARGKGLLQRVKGLKHELMLPIRPDARIAAASFNHHETFFGESFDIRIAGGEPASSGCVAFGIERWLLAFLVAHGPEPAGWPAIDLGPRKREY